MDKQQIAEEVSVRSRAASPALLVVDMQNDFVLANAPLEVPDSRRTIAPIKRLMGVFRQLGRPVVYTRFLSRREPNLLWHWSPQCWPETRCCWEGHRRRYEDDGPERDCWEVIDELCPEPGEHVVDKYGYGAFHGTDLDRILQELEVTSVFVTGTVSQICVEETAREAFHHGYRTTIVSDAVSSCNPDLHAAMLKNFAMKFGWVTDSRTAVTWL